MTTEIILTKVIQALPLITTKSNLILYYYYYYYIILSHCSFSSICILTLFFWLLIFSSYSWCFHIFILPHSYSLSISFSELSSKTFACSWDDPSALLFYLFTSITIWFHQMWNFKYCRYTTKFEIRCSSQLTSNSYL